MTQHSCISLQRWLRKQLLKSPPGVDSAAASALVGQCGSCAADVEEAKRVVGTLAVMGREFAQGREPRPVRTARTVPSLRRVLPLRMALRGAVALLLLAASAALGYAVREPRLSIVDTSSPRVGRVGQFALMSGLDFESAGFSPEASVLAWVSFARSASAAGTAVVVRRESGHLDLASFDERRQPLWVASRLWPDWGAGLGSTEVTLRVFKSIVTKRLAADAMLETLCLCVQRRARSLFLLIDPQTGTRSASRFIEGEVSEETPGRESAAIVPIEGSPERNVLVIRRVGPGAGWRTCASLLTTRGEVLQQLAFPTLSLPMASEPGVGGVMVDWSEGFSEATISTHEGLIFSILLRGGRLDLGSHAVAAFPDGFEASYDAHFGEGSLARRIQQAGGDRGFLEKLASEVRAEDGVGPSGWRTR